MCNETVLLPIPNEGGFVEAPIDKCIAPIVKALNDAGIETVESCCGHGQSGSIDLKDGRRIVVLLAGTQEKDHRRKVTLGTQEFDDLPEYSASLPTWGKYDDGRLLGTAKWKRKTKKGWLFGRATLEGDEVRIDWYEIVLADTQESGQ